MTTNPPTTPLTVQLTAQQLEGLSTVQFYTGNKEARSFGVSTSETPLAKSLVFTSSTEAIRLALVAQVNIIVAQKKTLHEPLTLNPDQAIFITDSIPSAMADVLKFFDDKKTRVSKGVSQKASISPSAQLGNNICIGDFAVVGDFACIGDDSILAPNVVIENHATLGKNCHIHPHVVIGARCQIGNNCEIYSNTTIGSDGFSFHISSQDQVPLKIPQVGIVVLEDNVEIGASCAIDRATLTETRIGSGTKLDNQIHIAHNVKIGKNCRITAGFIIAGSSEIGDNFLAGGNSSVTDHVKITSNVILAGKSAVTKNIDHPGAYGGYPLEPLKNAMKTIANLTHITTMRKQLHEVRKHLGFADSTNEKTTHESDKS